MDDCKSNQSSSKSPPLYALQMIDYSSIASGDYNSGRLSKVTEENSASNNTTNSLWDEHEEYECDEKETTTCTSSTPCPESLSLSTFDSLCLNTSSSYIHYLQQLKRHNNTPHAHYNESMIFDPDLEEEDLNVEHHHIAFIPERIRMLLERFATNGYIQSNAPPPATKALIESIPETAAAVISNEIIQCAICMLQVIQHDIIRTLPCNHYFHSKCIVTWLHIHASCPLCRSELQTTNNGVSETATATAETETSVSETRATNNRLQDLRRRRCKRRTLRRTISTTTTPISEDNEDNDDMHQAATQLIEAVCDVLKQYNQRTQNVNMDDLSRRTIDERVVRFNMKQPQAPNSSRSNTQTRNSLNDLHSPLFRFHAPNNTAPAHKLRLNDLEIDAYERSISVEHKEPHINAADEANEIISAKTIKQEFAKWMKRRSQLTTKSPELTPIYNSNDEDDYNYGAASHPSTPSRILLSAECSNQTMVERYFSGAGEIDDDDEDYDAYDRDSDYNNNDLYSSIAMMTREQLEIAEKRHRRIIYKQQCAIDQIQNEENKRMHSFWKCPQCRSNQSAFLFLPCRHLGVCIQCNSCKIIQKCGVCNAQIRQKILINFD